MWKLSFFAPFANVESFFDPWAHGEFLHSSYPCFTEHKGPRYEKAQALKRQYETIHISSNDYILVSLWLSVIFKRLLNSPTFLILILIYRKTLLAFRSKTASWLTFGQVCSCPFSFVATTGLCLSLTSFDEVAELTVPYVYCETLKRFIDFELCLLTTNAFLSWKFSRAQELTTQPYSSATRSGVSSLYFIAV